MLFPSSAAAQSVLPLNDFIETAVKHNPSYRISAQEYLIALEQNKSINSLEDWNLIASGFWNEATPAPISGFSAEYQKTTGYSIGLEKYFARTGTALKLEHGNTRIESRYSPPMEIPGIGTIDFNPPGKYYLSNLSLTITQPLLKNAFGLATRNALKLADDRLELARIKLAEDWEDFIATLRSEYLNWQKCHRNISLVENQAKTVEDQLALVRKQLQYGLSEDLDLVQTEQKLEAYYIMLEQAKLACESQTRKVLQLMGRAGAASTEFIPEEYIKKDMVIDESVALSYLASNSNVKRTADIMVGIQKTNLETKENAKRLDLNLVLKTSPNAFTEKFSDSFSKIGDYSDNSITLAASRPLGNDKAEAEAEQAGIEYEKSLQERQNLLLQAEMGLSSLYASLRHTTNILKLSENNLKLAKQRLALEKKKFDQGRSSVFFVLQAEDDLLQAENSLNETMFGREEIINQIKSFTDRYQIEYKDILKI